MDLLVKNTCSNTTLTKISSSKQQGQQFHHLFAKRLKHQIWFDKLASLIPILSPPFTQKDLLLFSIQINQIEAIKIHIYILLTLKMSISNRCSKNRGLISSRYSTMETRLSLFKKMGINLSDRVFFWVFLFKILFCAQNTLFGSFFSVFFQLDT